MNILKSLTTEIRSAFGFPQIIEVEQEEKPQAKVLQQNNYKIVCADGEEDHFEQLGAAV